MIHLASGIPQQGSARLSAQGAACEDYKRGLPTAGQSPIWQRVQAEPCAKHTNLTGKKTANFD